MTGVLRSRRDVSPGLTLRPSLSEASDWKACETDEAGVAGVDAPASLSAEQQDQGVEARRVSPGLTLT